MRDKDLDAAEMQKMIVWCMPGNTPKTLRALSFSFTSYQPPTQGNVVMRAHFFKPPTLDDLNDISVIETELYSAVGEDTFQFKSEVQIAPIGTKLRPLENMAWIDPAEAFRKA